MKIGVDIRALGGRRTGIGRFIIDLLNALARIDKENEYLLFYNALKGGRPDIELSASNFKMVTSRFPNKVLDRLWSASPFPHIETLTGPLDLFHAPNFQMPPVKSAGSVLTIHDLVFLIHPEMAAPGSIRDFSRKIGFYANRADIITADSKATAQDIARHLDIREDKIVIIYPGATLMSKSTDEDIKAVKKKYGINGSFILFVGCIEPRKNLARLLIAFEKSGLASDFDLVLAGPLGWHTEEIFSTMKSLECRARVRWLKYIPDPDLAAFYSGAAFFVFPSLLEGFGLPILEAMSVGCPLMTSNLSSMPEVAGDAALYVNPLEVDSIAAGMRRLAGDCDMKANLIRLGYERIKLFTWENTARAMLDIYGRAAEIAKEKRRKKSG